MGKKCITSIDVLMQLTRFHGVTHVEESDVISLDANINM
jgi:hypothetical protein